MDTAVDKALKILESIDTTRNGDTLADIAERTGLPKTTAHRLLSTLTQRGFVERTPWNGYTIGRKVIALGLAAGERDTLVDAARPTLHRLVETCSETVQLGVLAGGDQLIFIERIEPENKAVRIGRMPSPLAKLHTSAMGKAILAASTDEFITAYLQKTLNRYTDKTITDKDVFLEELQEVRRRGFAISNEEHYEGVFAVGAAVTNHEHKPIAAVSIAAPAHRVHGGRQKLMEAEIVKAAATISQIAGHSRLT